MPLSTILCRLLPATAGLLIGATAQATVSFVGPTPYLQAADNPFAATASVLYLETFEDGLANTPGLSVSGGVGSGQSVFSDSVDADDGVVDGSGAGGQSWYSAGSLGSISFSFSAATLGWLPTHVGIVFTDIGLRTDDGPLGQDWAFMQVYSGAGVLQGAASFYFGDGSAFSATAEDRFLGAVDSAGIGSIRVGFASSVDWEVDHLSHALGVPEPTTWALWAAGLVGLAGVARARGQGQAGARSIGSAGSAAHS